MILIFSNGFGETEIAKSILNKLVGLVDVKLYPLIGDVSQISSKFLGFVPRNYGSGGLTTRSLPNFLLDLLSGSVGELFRYIHSIKTSPRSEKVFIVGDPFLLMLVKSKLRFKVKTIFMSIYKSEISERHYWFEKYFIKKNVDYFLPRDRYTGEVFKKYGVQSVYLGNPMVDSVEVKGVDFRRDPRLKTLLLLPGSRDFAYKIIVKMLYVVESLFEKYGFFNVLWPIANMLDLNKIKDVLIKHRWFIFEESNKFVLKKNLIEVVAGKGMFGDMLNVSDVVLSTSGTATEQAAAFGKPTIMFFDPSIGISRSWFNRQKLLLGNNLKLFDRFNISDISDEIAFLFLNEDERTRRGKIGMSMIEGRGSIDRISKFLLSI
ncbi:MAG: hypothetical protein ACP5PT_02915 [Brevinematia bacterium]|jgi:tetraacyldisaccharide 4'-kinase